MVRQCAPIYHWNTQSIFETTRGQQTFHWPDTVYFNGKIVEYEYAGWGKKKKKKKKKKLER